MTRSGESKTADAATLREVAASPLDISLEPPADLDRMRAATVAPPLSPASQLAALGRAAFGAGWTAAATSGALVAQFVARDAELFCRATQGWGRVLARAWGMHVHVEAPAEPLPAPVVWMGNHQSYADIVALFAGLPAYPHFVAKAELARIPFLKQALHAGQHVLIERGGGKTIAEALRAAATKINEGRSVVIFPEGTRSADGQLGPLRSGGFRLAKAASVPVVPFAITGTRQVLPKGSWLVRKGVDVTLRVGAPIPTETVRDLPTRELMRRVADEISLLLTRPARLDAVSGDNQANRAQPTSSPS